MVPVPEEHEAEVAQFVLKVSLIAALSKWDGTSIRRLLDEGSEKARAVTAAMAGGLARGEGVSDQTIGEALGMAPDEVVEIAQKEVNARCETNGWPALLLMRSDFQDLPDGTQRLVHWFLIGKEAVRMVLEAESERNDV